MLALGVGSTGPLDRQWGCIQNPYILPGWEDVDIVIPLREGFGVPVALGNDADAATLGESWMGARAWFAAHGHGYHRHGCWVRINGSPKMNPYISDVLSHRLRCEKP